MSDNSKEQKLNSYRAKRQAAILKLGSICVRCGFSDERALQFDHIDGDGYLDREGNTACISVQILRGAGKYQLLCANCNWIKKAENNENSSRSRSKHETLLRRKILKVQREILDLQIEADLL